MLWHASLRGGGALKTLDDLLPVETRVYLRPYDSNYQNDTSRAGFTEKSFDAPCHSQYASSRGTRLNLRLASPIPSCPLRELASLRFHPIGEMKNEVSSLNFEFMIDFVIFEGEI